jgi:ribonuclease HI
MLVTINTDASYNSKLKIGAFSFWMVSNNGRLFGAGQLKGEIKHSSEAEFKSILNAMHFLKDKSGWTGIDKIIINTDSQQALDMINGKKTHAWAVVLKKSFNELRKQMKCDVEARKVKAHSGLDEKRKWVNNWCDKAAKKIIRSNIKKPTNENSIL